MFIKNLISLACAAALLTFSSARAETWIQTAANTYSWDDVANWGGVSFPNSIGGTAGISADFAGAQIINLNQAITVGSLTITDSGAASDVGVTIATGTAGSLTLQASSGSATLTTGSAVSNTISAPITFASSTTIALSGGSSTQGLILSGNLSGSGNITKNNGTSTLTISGADNSAFTGNWILNGGVSTSNFSLSSDGQLGGGNGTGTNDITLNNNNNIIPTASFTMNSNRSINIVSGTLYLSPTAGVTTTIAGKISGAGGITQQGNGSSIVSLTNNGNDFTGAVQIVAAPVTVSSIGNSTAASALGAGSAIFFGNGGFGGGGAITYTGTGDSSDKSFQTNGSAGNAVMTINNNGLSGALSLTNTGNAISSSSTGTRTITLGGTNTAANVFSEKINALGAGVVGFTKSGVGYWKLANETSDYTGVTTLSASGGTLEVTKLADGGAASTIGASTNVATNLLLGNATTLKYTGTGDSTNRLFTINGTAAGHSATLDASGSGAVNFTNTGSVAYNSNNQTRTVNLRGTNTDNNTLTALIGNNGSGAVSVTKADAGKWVLSGINTYTGATTVSGGTLIIDGSLAAGSAVTVNSGGTLGGSGTIGGTTTLNAGSKLSAGNNSAATLTFSGGLDISAAANDTGAFVFTLGSSFDQIVSNSLTLGTNVLGAADFSLTSGVGFTGGQAYTLFHSTSVSGTFLSISLLDIGGSGVNGTIDLSGNDVVLTTLAIPEPSTYALLAGMGVLALAFCSRKRG